MNRVVRTACTRDCPDACSVLAHVEGGRVVRLDGDPDHPVTRGFLCERTSRFVHRQNSTDRLTTPLVRRNGSLQPASWDEALDTCARALLRIRQESGPAAIFHYRSGGSLGILKSLSSVLFDAFGPVTGQRGSVCDGAGMAAQRADFGDVDSNDLDDLRNARSIVLWGKNPFVSSPHLLPRLREARRAGAVLVLIDPLRHRTASLCNQVLQPRPGGDASLALGACRVVFERGWVHPDATACCDGVDDFRAVVMARSVEEWAADADVATEDVVALAHRMARGAPVTILLGWGMQRRSNGGAIVRAIDALAAITGNVGIPGAGVSFYFKRRAAFDTTLIDSGRPAPRHVREPMFAADILAASEPPVRAVWISCGNPVVMLPDSHATIQALTSREFVVVVDSFLTDTARCATVVLPCATFLEDDDLVGAYGHPYLGVVRPAVQPPGQARTDLRILQDLAERLGLGAVLDGSARTWKQRLLRAVPLDRLEQGPLRNPDAPRVVFEGRRFPTASGRINLLRSFDARETERPFRFPLRLMAISTPHSQCSQWSPSEPETELPAHVHPDCCGGIADGSLAMLSSERGSMRVRMTHDDSVRRGLVVVPKGGSPSLGRGSNAITAARLTDLGEGAALYEEPVRLDPEQP